MKKKEQGLIYEPEVGLTINEAFARAILMAKKNTKPVHAIINDIEMDITAKTNLKRIVAAYQKKNKARYEAQIRAYELHQQRQNKNR